MQEQPGEHVDRADCVCIGVPTNVLISACVAARCKRHTRDVRFGIVFPYVVGTACKAESTKL
jgi:hypothetical protein